MNDRSPTLDTGGVCLFGAPLDTGNLGVSALGVSTIAAVARRRPASPVTVYDNGPSTRQSRLDLPDVTVGITHRGAWISRRVHRQESLWTMAALSRVPHPLLPNLRAIDEADLVLDVSGGDSFTDLYGQLRLQLVALPKRIALRRRRPLVLLPQTYGPFRSADNARLAGDLIAGTTQAWARDQDSFERLQELLGERFDPRRHLLGVDVAFALPPVDPGGDLDGIRGWLTQGDPPVGLNVSGLLANDAEAARARFGLGGDYAAAMEGFARRLLEHTDRRLLLVPHTRGGSAESDDEASARLATALGDTGRVRVLPPGLEAQHLKWVIGHLEWFCGARMHATIAALSSRVPVAVVAYSDKARGVFASCSLADGVVDARAVDAADLVDQLWGQWERRAEVRRSLQASMPEIIGLAERQFDQILAPARGATTDLGAR
jgi:colanic acid/amylovoran biosynthesis protein